MLVYRFLQKALPEIHLKIIQIIREFERRKMTNAKGNQQHPGDGISYDMVSIIVENV